MVHSLLIVAVQQHRYITTFTWFGLDRKLEGGWFSLNFKASEWLRKTAKCFSIWFENDCSEGDGKTCDDYIKVLGCGHETVKKACKKTCGMCGIGE